MELYERIENQPHPYRQDVRLVISDLNSMGEGIDRVLSKWRDEFLIPAKEHVPNVTSQDFDAYSKPILTLAEMIRRTGFSHLAHRLLLLVVRITDSHCKETPKDLHRGAMYANLGIAILERGDFELGLSFLLAAANEDVRLKRVLHNTQSYAWSIDGIYGQWVASAVITKINPAVFSFVATRLGVSIGITQLMEMLRALAGNGDLNLLRGILQYEAVRGRTDYVGHSVPLRMLARSVDAL